jgi:hypothetical protein
MYCIKVASKEGNTGKKEKKDELFLYYKDMANLNGVTKGY